jgi:predicted RND superfamily exporter protein
MIKAPRTKNIKKHLFFFIINHKILVSSMVLGMTLFFGWFAVQVKFDNTIETYFLENDLKDYRQFLDQFGTDELIVIAYGDQDIFTIENLHLIDTISGKLENLPYVRRVLSLTTNRIIYGEGESVYFDSLVAEFPCTMEELNSIREKAFADPVIPGTLISSDGKNTAIVAEVEHIIGQFDYKVELLNQIRALLKQEENKTGKRFYLGGTSVLDDALFRYTKRDQTRFFPIILIIIILIMFIMFLRIEMTVLPLLVIILSTIWTYGFLVLIGYKVNVISTIIGPFLMAVAVADSMHFIAHYLQETSVGKLTKREYIKRSFNNVITPCFMTSLTTSFGLLSLLSADLAPIRQFGFVAAAGVFFAFIITIFLLPILLFIIPLTKERHRKRILKGFFAKLLIWLGDWRRRRAMAVLLISLLAIIPATLSLMRLNVGTNSLDYFRENDIVRVQTEWIDANIGGTTSLEFYIETGIEDALKNPALLRKMENVQKYLEGIKGVTGAYSLVDMVKSLNRAFHGGDDRKLLIPSTFIAITQQLIIVEGSEEIKQLVSDDFSTGRITARVQMNESQRLAHRMPEIKRRIQDIFTKTVTPTPTGVIYLMNQMESDLLSSQIKSFMLAFIIITLLIMVMLRSFKLGILAMIPNFLPILFTLALMPILDIALDVGTAMIAGIALGLVVDDTIHFLTRLKIEVKQSNDIKRAITDSIISTGRPIIFTSIILSLGFLVLLFASFNPIIHFGILAGTVILFAVVFDLIVLPSIFCLTKKLRFS